jgi:hypothetical protein
MVAAAAVWIAAAAGACRRPSSIAAADIETSIDRGLSFLRRDRSDLSALVVLDYLQRKYALPRDLAFAAMRSPAAADADRLRAWGRFVGADRPDDVAPLPPLADDPTVEEVVIHALDCDLTPLPPSFPARLERFARRGDYEATHAALALKLAGDRSCPLDSSATSALRAKLRQRILEIIEKRPNDVRFEALDVHYEAAAIFQDLLGERDLPAGVVAKLIREQQPDGGWRPAPDQPSRPHPTALAIWALLAHIHPDAPTIRFARR